MCKLKSVQIFSQKINILIQFEHFLLILTICGKTIYFQKSLTKQHFSNN